jgi:DNA helicase-2/ATP-dependent DNA helicase PcrA
LKGRAKKMLSAFLHLIDDLAEESRHFEMDGLIERTLEKTGLLMHYQQEKGEKAQARVENLEELITAVRQFQADDTQASLQNFLTQAALESGETQSDAQDDCIHMMTLHAAKGLEFPWVIISGMEEGLFPHKMSVDNSKRLEEERRLFYVGITRAMQRVLLTYAERRRLHGKENYHLPSRFIKELPSDCVQEIRLQSQAMRPRMHTRTDAVKAQPHKNDSPIGTTVFHKKFGAGIVLNSEGQGDNKRVQVKFDNGSTKWLIASFVEVCS